MVVHSFWYVLAHVLVYVCAYVFGHVICNEVWYGFGNWFGYVFGSGVETEFVHVCVY